MVRNGLDEADEILGDATTDDPEINDWWEERATTLGKLEKRLNAAGLRLTS